MEHCSKYLGFSGLNFLEFLTPFQFSSKFSNICIKGFENIYAVPKSIFFNQFQLE